MMRRSQRKPETTNRDWDTHKHRTLIRAYTPTGNVLSALECLANNNATTNCAQEGYRLEVIFIAFQQPETSKTLCP